MCRSVVSLLALLLMPEIAVSQEIASLLLNQNSPNALALNDLFNKVLYFTGALAVIFLTIRYIRKRLPEKPGGKINILASRRVSPTVSIHVVKLGKEVILVNSKGEYLCHLDEWLEYNGDESEV